MVEKSIVLVHTLKPLIGVFDRLCDELLPGVKVYHILDEPLLERIRRRNQLTEQDASRLAEHVMEAENIGARVVLVTCSSISPCVDDILSKVKIPVIKIDEAMIAEAVRLGSQIGVVATNVTTLEPTRDLLVSQAKAIEKRIDTKLVLVDNALDELLSGDGDQHDRLVKKAVLQLSTEVDVVVLAQASMARVLEIISEAERIVPVLSSPQLAVQKIRAILMP